MIDITDTPHGLHLDTDGGTPVTLSPDAVTAIVQHELGKLGLWWAEEQRALVTTTPDNDGYFLVLGLDDLADGPCWCDPFGAQTGSDPVARAVAAYLASLPAEPKPGETWELNDSIQTWEATVVEICGTLCFAWPGTTAPSLRPVDNMGRCTRRKITEDRAPDRDVYTYQVSISGPLTARLGETRLGLLPRRARPHPQSPGPHPGMDRQGRVR